MPVEAGQEAPDFTLRDQNGSEVTLSAFRGEKNVVLVFYPLAFTPTCTGELCAIRDEHTVFTQKIFAEKEGYTFQLLSDFWPHGATAQKYGIFLEERGFPKRGTFIIDKAGVVRWQVVNSPADARRTDDYREALAAL